jgi:hypothetical protein
MMVHGKQRVADRCLAPLQRGDRRYVIGGYCRFLAVRLDGKPKVAAFRFSDIGA